MVEAEANSELVHLTRSMQHEQAADPNLAPPPPRPGLDVFASALSQEIATAKATTEEASQQSIPIEAAQANTLQPETDAPRTPDTAFRQTRLLVTVGLVVLLLVVWIIQRRSSTRH